MPTNKRSDPAVSAFMRALDHPQKREIEAVRELMLGVSPLVREAIKWNAPSFLVNDHFATLNLRPGHGVRLIFHTGAKKRSVCLAGIQVADPDGLLEWLAVDRCLVVLGDLVEIARRRRALQSIASAWLRALETSRQ